MKHEKKNKRWGYSRLWKAKKIPTVWASLPFAIVASLLVAWIVTRDHHVDPLPDWLLIIVTTVAITPIMMLLLKSLIANPETLPDYVENSEETVEHQWRTQANELARSVTLTLGGLTVIVTYIIPGLRFIAYTLAVFLYVDLIVEAVAYQMVKKRDSDD